MLRQVPTISRAMYVGLTGCGVARAAFGISRRSTRIGSKFERDRIRRAADRCGRRRGLTARRAGRTMTDDPTRIATMCARSCRAWLAALAAPAGIAGGALFAGCGSEDVPSDAKTHIRFSGYTGNPAETNLLAQLVSEFNASNPDLAVTYEPVPGQYYPKILTMLVAKTAPD